MGAWKSSVGTIEERPGPPAGNAPPAAGGDLDGDGHPGLVVTSDEVLVFRGDREGGLEHMRTVPVGPNPVDVAVTDLDGDGALDLVTAAEHEAAAHVYLGDGAGGFEEHPQSPFAMGRGGKKVASGDFDGDGVADAAVAAYSSPQVLLLLGGTEGFRTATVHGGVNPWALTALDLDGDGRDELVVGEDVEGELRVHAGRSRWQ